MDKITRYLDTLGLCQSTYMARHYRLKAFFAYLEKNHIPYQTLEETQLEEWLEYLSIHRGNSPRTLLEKVGLVRSFYTWAVREGYLLVHPIGEDFYRPKIIRGITRVPKPSQTLEVLKKANSSIRFPVRNRAMLELCYGTGLRRCELERLNLVDLGCDELLVIGKGGKERLVPLNRSAVQWISRYIAGERLDTVRRHNPLEEALFVGVGGRRLSGQSYGVIFRTQIKSPWSPHCFRHACATHMLQNGAGIRVLQKLLGHECLSTTQMYTKVETGHVKQMLEKCHPRG